VASKVAVYGQGKPGIRRLLGSWFGERARSNRHEIYRATIGPRADETIVDIGCGAGGLAQLEPDSRITGVDLSHRPPDGYEAPHRDYVQADARDLPFANKAFDVAYSNSLIEHLKPSDRVVFANEVKRVARVYFIQTPNRWFIIEPHVLLPLFQHLPLAARRRLWRFGVSRSPFEDVRLIDARELRSLFPDAVVVREKVGPLTKSLMAVGPRHEIDGALE
jgi:SAM-dependent methyltransferase